MKQKSFFEKFAHEYDWMTNASERAIAHEKEVDALINTFHPTHVLDAGCATGLTASLFAQRGIQTVGLDRVQAMLKQARSKFDSFGLPLRFCFGQFESLPKNFNGSFDMVVCLANSIVGVETNEGLARSFKSFHQVLMPGGVLVLQLLNHESLQEGKIHPIRMTRHEHVLYLRYLERVKQQVRLSIIRADMGSTISSFEVFPDEYDAFSSLTLTKALQGAGFVNPRFYADLAMRRKINTKSRDIVLVAGKPAQNKGK
jgi:ubiquinone/menaquinone biosynthesis C-methylase UbiE